MFLKFPHYNTTPNPRHRMFLKFPHYNTTPNPPYRLFLKFPNSTPRPIHARYFLHIRTLIPRPIHDIECFVHSIAMLLQSQFYSSKNINETLRGRFGRRQFEGRLTVHLHHEINWNATLIEHCNLLKFFSSTCFGRIPPSSGALGC